MRDTLRYDYTLSLHYERYLGLFYILGTTEMNVMVKEYAYVWEALYFSSTSYMYDHKY